MMQYSTREAWLTAGAEAMRPWFQAVGYEFPTFRIGLGFTSQPMKAIGQCWAPEASADASRAIFIAPMLEAVDALDTLAHELCHACLDHKVGHRIPFKRLATLIGLEGKPATHMRAGPFLRKRLEALAESLGEYPHAALDPNRSGKKKQGTRLLKAECMKCGYTFRVTAKWADKTNICPNMEEHDGGLLERTIVVHKPMGKEEEEETGE